MIFLFASTNHKWRRREVEDNDSCEMFHSTFFSLNG